jgi:hypothetical protein
MKIIDKTQEFTPRLYTPAELQQGCTYILVRGGNTNLIGRIVFGATNAYDAANTLVGVDNAGVPWFKDDDISFKFQKIEAELTILKRLSE